MAEKPNDTARLQFLAVLEYLLTKTDEDHLSRTSDIQKYAEEQYDVSLRREQVKAIVEHIYDLCKTHKEVLPYEIKCSNKTGVNKKYYCSKKKFDMDVIVKVCSAIKNDKTINDRDTTAIINQLVKDYVVLNEQSLAKKKITQRNRKIKKMDERMSTKLDKVYDLELSRNIFSFSLISTTNDVFSSSSESFGPNEEVIKERQTYYGVVIKVEEDEETQRIFLYIYIQQLKGIIKTRFDNLENIEDWGSEYGRDLLKEPVQRYTRYLTSKNGRFDSLERQYGQVEEIMQKRWGKQSTSFLNEDIEFKICIGRRDDKNTKLLKDVSTSFKNYFGKEMEYEEKERNVIFDEGTDEERTVVAIDAYIKVTTNFHSFKEWVTKKAHILGNVVVMTPEFRRWNDRLVSGMIELFVRRLNKYGFTYKYTITKELTDEARAEIEAREARRREREQYLRARKLERNR